MGLDHPDLGVDVVGASLAAAYDENLTVRALTENATLANLSVSPWMRQVRRR